MFHHLRSRWTALAVTVLLIGSGLAFHFTHPATVRAATTPTMHVTLLLVHGYTDTCDYAFNETDLSPNTGANASTTVNYLTSQGWSRSNIDEIGYYDPSIVWSFQRYDQNWYYATDDIRGHSDSDGNGHTAYGQCDHNLYETYWPSSLGHAANCPNITSNEGNENEHIQSLGCELAWYIYDTYTAWGKPVSILAHSMGGLIVRDALAESGNTYGYPPRIDVRYVVTVATPHGGLQGSYLSDAQQRSPSTEVNDMSVGSSFMNMLAGSRFQKPQGSAGTHWALMGADVQCVIPPGGTNSEVAECTADGNAGNWPDGDTIVQGESAMAMNADYKVLYGVGLDAGIAKKFVGDSTTEYAHEANSCGPYQWWFFKGFGCLSYPFYLNDGSGGTVSAWLCTSNCTANIADFTSDGNGTVGHSLAVIVSQLGPTSLTLSTTSLVLRSHANLDYVSNEMSYTGGSQYMLRARATSLGSWESWTEVFLPSNGLIALQSNANGLFVSNEIGYTGSDQYELRARASVIGPWETFQLVWLSSNTYALKSLANGLYVSAELGYTGGNYGELRARSGSIGSWETFTDSTLPAGCTDYGSLTIGPNGCSGFSVAGTSTSGTVDGWYSSNGAGLMGQTIWTYANGTVKDSSATYSFTGLSTSYAYKIEAYIPNCCSDATHAHYHIHSAGGGDVDAYINQQNFTNQWDTTDLGFVCTSDGNATVTLADDGGDNYPLAIGADAIKLVVSTYKCFY